MTDTQIDPTGKLVSPTRGVRWILQVTKGLGGFAMILLPFMCFPGDSVVKNPPTNAGYIKDRGLIPGEGRSSGGGHGNPHQYSCLENPMTEEPDGRQVHRVKKSQRQLKWLSTQACMYAKVAQSCPALYDPMDPMDPPGNSIHGIFQARILQWVAISFSRCAAF